MRGTCHLFSVQRLSIESYTLHPKSLNPERSFVAVLPGKEAARRAQPSIAPSLRETLRLRVSDFSFWCRVRVWDLRFWARGLGSRAWDS